MRLGTVVKLIQIPRTHAHKQTDQRISKSVRALNNPVVTKEVNFTSK